MRRSTCRRPESKLRFEELTASVEVGKTYNARWIVQVMQGKDGLLHVSQIANQRVDAVADFLKEGQAVRVKVRETLSMKQRHETTQP